MIEIYAGLVLYLMPFIVLLIRKPVAWGLIAMIALFLGWTIIGWVVAICMACYCKTQADEVRDAALKALLLAAETATRKELNARGGTT